MRCWEGCSLMSGGLCWSVLVDCWCVLVVSGTSWAVLSHCAPFLGISWLSGGVGPVLGCCGPVLGRHALFCGVVIMFWDVLGCPVALWACSGLFWGVVGLFGVVLVWLCCYEGGLDHFVSVSHTHLALPTVYPVFCPLPVCPFVRHICCWTAVSRVA